MLFDGMWLDSWLSFFQLFIEYLLHDDVNNDFLGPFFPNKDHTIIVLFATILATKFFEMRSSYKIVKERISSLLLK